MNYLLRKIITFTTCILLVGSLFSQSSFISGQDSLRNPITVGVPFINFAPDSRASAMGDVGVATSPDVNSVHWNNAKLAFIESNIGFSFSYSPWLRNIVDDMSLSYLSFYKKIDQVQAFGFSFRYFDFGEIALFDERANSNGIENPSELAVDATYSRKLSKSMSIGVTTRFIWSNLAGNITGAPDAKAATSVAIDLGWYFKRPFFFAGKESEIAVGVHLSNIGQKVTYSSESNENFIPANFRVGTALKINLDLYNSFTFAFDINKLMVPTPPIYLTDSDGNIETDANGDKVIAKGKDPNRTLLSGTFGSFSDAPNGFKEELQELTYSVGLEYWYKDLFAVRTGYFAEHQNKGNRKYITIGAGFRYQVFGFDFSYLIPSDGQNHPLADTIRLSLLFNLDKKAKNTNSNISDEDSEI